jgi:hypothetical protein
MNQWLVTLLSAFLVGLLLLSNHVSAMTMSLEHHGDEGTVSETNVYPTSVDTKDEQNHHASPESCCRACCPSCFLMAIQLVVDIPCGDKLKVADSVPVFQIVFIKSIIPPPKA